MAEEQFKGLIQVYTGDGKGKTTAALGQAIRACGQGLRVIFIQFLKGQAGGEHLFADKFKRQTQKCHCEEPAGDEAILPFEIVQFGKGDLFKKPEQELLQETMKAYQFAQQALVSGKYDLVVLDEIFIAHWRGLLSLQQLLDLMQMKPDNVELIMTGRKAPQEVVKRADLVTEMLVIKHPFAEGVQQRKGIEY
jgi:cob(I)alamin adenosyltransferase